tara:strand:+ start:10052 stop:10654 length:603 start_codon:yes stop_codon:yes gene_type:complete
MTSFKDSFYKQKLVEFGPKDVRSLGWGSRCSQEKRFQTILEAGISSGESVLDIGCGFGDFAKYLQSKKIDAHYCGIDTNEDFVQIIKKNNPLLTVYNENIKSHLERNIEYDWVVASGVFCFDEKNWEDNVYEKVNHMLLLAKKGVIINFLSNFFLKKTQKGFRRCYPEEVLKILRRFSTPFLFRHDYLDNDFTVYLLKRE